MRLLHHCVVPAAMVVQTLAEGHATPANATAAAGATIMQREHHGRGARRSEDASGHASNHSTPSRLPGTRASGGNYKSMREAKEAHALREARDAHEMGRTSGSGGVGGAVPRGHLRSASRATDEARAAGMASAVTAPQRAVDHHDHHDRHDGKHDGMRDGRRDGQHDSVSASAMSSASEGSAPVGASSGGRLGRGGKGAAPARVSAIGTEERPAFGDGAAPKGTRAHLEEERGAREERRPYWQIVASGS